MRPELTSSAVEVRESRTDQREGATRVLAEPSETHAQETAEITALIDAAVRHQSEPDPFLALHAEDVVIVNIAGRRVISKPPCEAPW
jgi:hypothetical protein